MRSGKDSHESASPLARRLERCSRFISHFPRATLCCVVLLTVLSLVTAGRFLAFRTDRSDLIDPRADFHKRWLDYTQEFGDGSDAVFVVRGPSQDAIERVVDDLGEALRRQPELFERVLDRVDTSSLQARGLQYLTPDELERLLGQLDVYRPLLEGQWERAGLESYARRLALHIDSCREREADEELQQSVAHAGLLTESLAGFLQAPEQFQTPWPSLIDANSSGAEQPVRYLMTGDGTLGFVLVEPAAAPAGFSGESVAIDRLREIADETAAAHPGTVVALTGVPILEADEMRRSQEDMARASIISFVAVGLVLLVGFRGFRHPLLALLMLAVGVSWSLGFTTIAVGHLNILSVSFAVILIGLGIDHAIHFLTRYLELRRQGTHLRGAITRTSSEIGTGIVASATTTAVAFLTARLTNFLGVAELGVIAAGGIMLCAAAAFLVLPALVSIVDRKTEPRALPTPFQGQGLRSLIARRPAVISLLTVCVLVAIGFCGFRLHDGRLQSRVRYDANLLNLQAQDIESVDVLEEVVAHSSESLLYAVSIADSPAGARRLKREFEQLPTVSRVEEAASMLPAFPPSETGLLIQGVRARLSRIADLPAPEVVDPASVGASLEELFVALQTLPDSEAQQTLVVLDQLLTRLEAIPAPGQVELLSGYQLAMLTALRTQFVRIAEASDPQPIVVDDLPSAYRDRFLSERGRWLLKIYAREPLWDEEPLAAFVHDVRTVDPEATGTPLQNFEAARQLRDSYLNAAVYASVAIFLVLLIDSLETGPLRMALIAPCGVVLFAVVTLHGAEQSINPLWLVCLYASIAAATAALFDITNVRNTFLAMIPPLGGGLLLFGLLGLFGISLNPANLIVLPLILGIGVDYGVYVMHDFRLQHGRGYFMSGSTMNAVVLTSITSMVGFGSMLGASHRGLASLGLVLVIGIACCMLLSIVTLPALLTCIAGRRDESAGVISGVAEESSEQPDVLPWPKSSGRRSA